LNYGTSGKRHLYFCNDHVLRNHLRRQIRGSGRAQGLQHITNALHVGWLRVGGFSIGIVCRLRVDRLSVRGLRGKNKLPLRDAANKLRGWFTICILQRDGFNLGGVNAQHRGINERGTGREKC